MTPPSRAKTSTLREGLAVLAVAIRREPYVFAVAGIGSVLFGALTVADAWVLGWATDEVLVPSVEAGEVDGRGVVVVAALFVAVALVRAVAIVARRLGAGMMNYRMEAHDRRAVTRQYLRLPLAWHHRHPTGTLLSIANSDVEAAWGPIAPLPMAVGVLAMMVVAIVQMLATDLVMAAVGLLVFPAVIATNIVYQRISSPLQRRAQHLRAQVAEVAHESFDGALVIKTLGREVEETERFAADVDELRDTLVRAGRVQAAFDPIMEQIPNIGVLAVLVVGVVRVLNGDAVVGDVVTISYLLVMVSFPIRAIGWLLGSLPRSVVGYDRVRAVLGERERMEFGTRRLPGGADGLRVEVDQLAFGYTHDGPRVLDDVSFRLEPGRTVAIVGATASGKSTLTTLMTRLVDPDGGQIRYDGVVLPELAPGALAEQVALVPQQAFLFDDTVRNNITLGVDLPDRQVWAALEAAQAAGFVRDLAAGLDARLGERGTSLSGGQRQRLSLARALVRRPRLLLLDDATSAVDPEVEARILAAIRSRGEGSAGEGSAGGDAAQTGATLVVVAYRKATIALADEVVFLADGRVADQGPHDELLARNPAYADLVNAYDDSAADGVGTPRALTAAPVPGGEGER